MPYDDFYKILQGGGEMQQPKESNVIAVIAGCHAEFVNFVRQRSREVGGDVSSEYFYVGTPEQAHGRHFTGIKRVGRYLWRRDYLDILAAIERNLIPRQK